MSGNKYQFDGGQFGAVGDGATAVNVNFQAAWQAVGPVDLAAAAVQLAALRQAIQADFAADPSTERVTALAAIDHAKTAALADDGPGVLASLKPAAAWLAEVVKAAALGVGVPVAVQLVKTSLGMP
jgi:hypothetical protein